MTEEQKDILIAKMLDAPSSLSDMEIESILSDEELRDIYEMSAAVSGAFIDLPDFDMADEWNQFRPKIRRMSSRMRWVVRVAAIFLGVAFAGGVMVRMIDRPPAAPKPTIAKAQDIKKSVEIKSMEKESRPDEIQKKEDSRLGSQRNNTASSGQHASKSSLNKTTQTELTEEDIDIDTYLRIQQARIDNDLAMMTAESYLYEYNEFLQNIEDIEAYDTTELENAIRQVTMQ
ncbi:MAG: hypothetical protein K2I92_03070 [Muribaculaceae bacterium]|nr:hypothetical protein [Muribaculaceae bacterium]